MVPGLHGFDLVIVLAIALLIFGPKKLPEIGSSVGKSIREYRKSMRELPAPQDEEVQTLSTSSKAAREDERPGTKAAAPAVLHEESEAERSKGA
jgi:TatA/E family protein of Tat protein translocase